MHLHPRYDSDPNFFDEKGKLKCSEWLFDYYYTLNGADDRTESQVNAIDEIRDAATKGSDALKELEDKLRKME